MTWLEILDTQLVCARYCRHLRLLCSFKHGLQEEKQQSKGSSLLSVAKYHGSRKPQISSLALDGAMAGHPFRLDSWLVTILNPVREADTEGQGPFPVHLTFRGNWGLRDTVIVSTVLV